MNEGTKTISSPKTVFPLSKWTQPVIYALAESLVDRFNLIRQLDFQTGSRFQVSLCSLFLSGLHVRLIRCIGIACWWLPLTHCFINLIRFLLSLFVLQIPNFGVYCGGRLTISQGLATLMSFQVSQFLRNSTISRIVCAGSRNHINTHKNETLGLESSEIIIISELQRVPKRRFCGFRPTVSTVFTTAVHI
ncbi:Hypothetical_protein [Hexamita inflata]|uniref:Hypothetical_protein n=1 Tax=Hexamita inflata TaxID=28002 RepID=A0AA86TUT1_9EUKA|nr:Hypothetical protein HINF_LOCUS17310 [Hexamita inflata]